MIQYNALSSGYGSAYSPLTIHDSEGQSCSGNVYLGSRIPNWAEIEITYPTGTQVLAVRRSKTKDSEILGLFLTEMHPGNNILDIYYNSTASGKPNLAIPDVPYSVLPSFPSNNRVQLTPWEELNASSGFSARNGQNVVWLPTQKEWLMLGGTDGFNTQNDSYILPSGSTIWSYAGTAPWEDRANFAAAYNEIDQSVYIWGGGNCDNTCNSSTYLNDTWHTPASNLSAWMEDTESAEFPARLLPQNGMSINSMYGMLSISGSYNNDTINTNSIYTSVNGKTWTLLNSSAGFPVRHAAQIVNHTGKNPREYIIGGYGNNTNYNDAWYSQNLVMWTKTSNSVWPTGGRPSEAAVDFGGYIQIFFGGHNDNVGYYSDWVVSPDGINYNTIDSNPGWGLAGGGRRYANVATNGTAMLMTGGNNGEGLTPNYNDTWLYIADPQTINATGI